MVLVCYLYYFSFPKLFMGYVRVLFARYRITDNLQQGVIWVVGDDYMWISWFF